MSAQMLDEEISAPFINRFSIRLFNNGIARITFGEALVEKNAVARAAVTMTVDDAAELCEMLNKLIAQSKSGSDPL